MTPVGRAQQHRYRGDRRADRARRRHRLGVSPDPFLMAVAVAVVMRVPDADRPQEQHADPRTGRLRLRRLLADGAAARGDRPRRRRAGDPRRAGRCRRCQPDDWRSVAEPSLLARPQELLLHELADRSGFAGVSRGVIAPVVRRQAPPRARCRRGRRPPAAAAAWPASASDRRPSPRRQRPSGLGTGAETARRLRRQPCRRDGNRPGRSPRAGCCAAAAEQAREDRWVARPAPPPARAAACLRAASSCACCSSMATVLGCTLRRPAVCFCSAARA